MDSLYQYLKRFEGWHKHLDLLMAWNANQDSPIRDRLIEAVRGAVLPLTN